VTTCQREGFSDLAQRFAFATIGSTQTEAIRRVQAGAAPAFRVVARVQETGLGRLDHGWSSPAGGLYLSLALPARRPPTGLWPVGIGSAVGGALTAVFGVPTFVKWPNDVLAGRSGRPAGKLAGILVDRLATSDGQEAIVVGLGLNCATARSAFPPELAKRVAILSELAGRSISPEETEPVVVDAIERTAQQLASAEGERAVWAECRRALWGIGRAVRVDGAPMGRMRDLAEDGALLVEDERGIRAVRAGEVVLEGAA
jgi:BirA family transcriptional regulator, biotin operon repressor / biotin---[acetyl-CoA-carboxylase] ligase